MRNKPYSPAGVFSPRRICRWFLAGPKTGASGLLIHLTTLGVTLFPFIGYVRSRLVDSAIIDTLVSTTAALHDLLIQHGVRPDIAQYILWAGCFVTYSSLVFIAARTVSNLHGFISSLVIGEFHRRQGHRFSRVRVVACLSLLIDLALSLSCTSVLSVLAFAHFLATYAYIRVSHDVRRIDELLEAYAEAPFSPNVRR